MAESSTALPKRSRAAILKRTVTAFRADNLTDWGAALTYYAVLSMFPALIAMVSLVGLFGDPQTVTRTLTDAVSQLGPSDASDTFAGPVQSITSHRGSAGVLFVVGVAGALWTASGYVGAFSRAGNAIYGVEEARPFWKLRPLQILVTFVMVVLLALTALAVVATGPVARSVGASIGIGDTAVDIWNVAKWPVLLLVVIAMIAILYHTAPNVRMSRFRWITPGGIVAIAVWLLASAGFALYVSRFGSYDKTYGTLGGVVSFLVWLWLTNVAILFGAELNAEIERSHGAAADEEGAPASQDDSRSADTDDDAAVAPRDRRRLGEVGSPH